MDSEPRAEGALEACAAEMQPYMPGFSVHAVAAFLRKYGLRGPDECQPGCGYGGRLCDYCRTTQEERP